MLASAQLEILDAFCGAEHLAGAAGSSRRAFARAREIERELEELRDAGRRARARPRLPRVRDRGDRRASRRREDEEAELERERARLGAVESLRTAAATAAEALDPADDDGGALARMAAAGAELDRAAGADDALDALASRFGSLTFELQDVAGELRALPRLARGRPGAPRGGRGAPRPARPPEAKARRHDRGGARARRALPRRARPARRRRGGHRPARAGARDRDRRRWARRPHSCTRRAPPRPGELAERVVAELGRAGARGRDVRGR